MKALQLGVDLLPLRPDGSNGGVKPAILEFISWFLENKDSEIGFVFFCNSQSQHELRNLCRQEDSTVCLLNLDGVEPLSPDLLTPKDYNRVGQSSEVLEEFPLDLLWAPFGPTSLTYPGVPIISMVVDLLHRDYPSSLPHEEIVHRERYFQDIVNKSSLIQVISEYTQSRLIHHYSVPSKQVFVTHLPIHNRLAKSKINGHRPVESPYFFFPANFWPHKNHEVLLFAFFHYIKENRGEPWKLVFTGHESSRKQRIQELARSLGVQNHLIFLDYISDDELENYWGHANALVFPSLHEGFGIPIIEAMHYEVPVICHQGTSLVEIGADACQFCDCRNPLSLAEAMIRVSSDSVLRRTLVKSGREQLSSFNLDAIVTELFQKMVEVLESKQTPLTSSGIYPDGWIGKKCVFNLPKKLGRTEFNIDLYPFSKERYLSVFLNEYPFGSHDLEIGKSNSISFFAFVDGQNLKIEANDTTQLSEADPRSFGARIKSISLRPENQELIWIWNHQ